MNKTLIDIFNNAEAVKATNGALLDSFKEYIHKETLEEWQFMKHD